MASSILSPRHEPIANAITERNHRNLSGPAPNIDDHITAGFGNGQTGTNRGGHRLDREDLTGAAPSALSLTARFSTSVIPKGTQI